jgi:hypothetical protein
MTFGQLIAFAIVTSAVAGCSRALPFDDPFEQNLARSQTVTLSAGNAAQANEAIQVIDPWPRYVYDTHIPGDGQRMADAVDRYEDVSKLSKAAKPITPIYNVSGTSLSGGGGGNGGQ